MLPAQTQLVPELEEHEDHGLENALSRIRCNTRAQQQAGSWKFLIEQCFPLPFVLSRCGSLQHFPFPSNTWRPVKDSAANTHTMVTRNINSGTEETTLNGVQTPFTDVMGPYLAKDPMPLKVSIMGWVFRVPDFACIVF